MPIQVLDAAAEVNGQKVYAYDAVTFTLINGVPFRSLRSTVKMLPVTFYKLSLVIDTGLAYKGYYYFKTLSHQNPIK